MRTKSYLKVQVTRYAQRDKYNEGCIGPDVDNGIIETFKVHNSARLIEEITERYGKPYLFEDRLEFQRTENDEGFEPSELEIEQWKKDNCFLYLVDYSFYVTRVIEDSWDNQTFKEQFSDILEEL